MKLMKLEMRVSDVHTLYKIGKVRIHGSENFKNTCFSFVTNTI